LYYSILIDLNEITRVEVAPVVAFQMPEVSAGSSLLLELDVVVLAVGVVEPPLVEDGYVHV
jgi:hypothetical protein